MKGKLPSEDDFWSLIEEIKGKPIEKTYDASVVAMGKNYPYRKFMHDLFEKKKSELRPHLTLEPNTSSVVLEGKEFYSKIKKEKISSSNEKITALKRAYSTHYMWAFLPYEEECPFQITTYDDSLS